MATLGPLRSATPCLWLASAFSLVLATPSCWEVSTLTRDSDEQRAARTKYLLGVLASDAFAAVRASGRYAPVSAKEFTAWLAKWTPEESRAPDAQWYVEVDGMLVDAWGRPIVTVLNAENALIGLGSCGANGLWERGLADDIIVSLSEEGVPIGPPGERVLPPGLPGPAHEPTSAKQSPEVEMLVWFSRRGLPGTHKRGPSSLESQGFRPFH